MVLKTIYVSGLNVRYPIHDDVNIENVFREYDNVKAYQFEGLGLGQAVGGGTRSGGLYNIKGLKCHTEQRSVNPATNIFPFSFHNNASFVRESKLTIENSEFTSYTGGVSMAYGSIGSGQNDIISLIGNKLQGKIVLFEETVGSGVGIDFELTGHGNTSVPVEIVETNASNYKYILNEEVSIKKNRAATAIVKGDLVKLSSTGQGVEKLGVSDGAVLFYGISFEI